VSDSLVGTSGLVPAQVEEVAVIAPPSGHHVQIDFYTPIVDIPPGQTETITVHLARYFKADRIVVARSIAPDFDVVDFKIGMVSQIAIHNGGIPAVVFHENAINMSFDTAAPTLNISLVVRNVSDHTSRFTAKLEGRGLASESWDEDELKPWFRSDPILATEE
jgi:hypothetical protein